MDDSATNAGGPEQSTATGVKLFRGDRPWPDLQHRPVIVVDDGIAAGSTLRVAVQALHNTGAVEIKRNIYNAKHNRILC